MAWEMWIASASKGNYHEPKLQGKATFLWIKARSGTRRVSWLEKITQLNIWCCESYRGFAQRDSTNPRHIRTNVKHSKYIAHCTCLNSAHFDGCMSCVCSHHDMVTWTNHDGMQPILGETNVRTNKQKHITSTQSTPYFWNVTRVHKTCKACCSKACDIIANSMWKLINTSCFCEAKRTQQQSSWNEFDNVISI